MPPESLPDTSDRSAARSAGLRYVHDGQPGIRRVGRGKRVGYVDSDGSRITDDSELQRIRQLAVPPAYERVWICADARGHIQATGRDARGRKQYRYHSDWRVLRDSHKYERLLVFGQALPAIRRRIALELAVPGLSVQKMVAAVVWLLDHTTIRIGNEAYARDNASFGLTTLRRRHVQVKGARVELKFRGKSGVGHAAVIADARVVKVLRACLEVPGQELFSTVDDSGEPRSIGSGHINDWLRQELAEADDAFTAKDFRTWHGSVRALKLLRELPPADSETAQRGQIAEVIREVAARLNNTAAVCRKCYVHPQILQDWREGCLPDAPTAPRGLDADERRLLALLRKTRGVRA